MMEPSRKQLAALAEQLANTRAEELDCDQVLHLVAAYLEATQEKRRPSPELEMVHQHLSVCPSCLEEFEALLRAANGD